VSVAARDRHCLALSREGEVYSWGDGLFGSLGHSDGGKRNVPSRIESLSQIESIAAGPCWNSSAVDDHGRLFTWGRATYIHKESMPNGLGYALDSESDSQLTLKWVEALSEDRVLGVAFGFGFTLTVTDAGAVFSVGYGRCGALGHGSLEAEVLPRRINGLTQTKRRFIAVAAGCDHALALTDDGELYGWGSEFANGLGRLDGNAPTPRQMDAFIGQRVKHLAPSCRRLIFVRCDGNGRDLHLGWRREWPARPRGRGVAIHAKAGGGAERSEGCRGGDM